MDRFSRVATYTIVIIFASLFPYINGLIPGPCASAQTLSSKRCCPSPMMIDPNADQCGENLTPSRGRCEDISGIVTLDDSSTDNRMNWPHYFDNLCRCNGNYAGYDCGECKFGYRGEKCDEPYMRKRRSITSLNSEERDEYIRALEMAKMDDNYDRYMAIADNEDPPKLVSVPLYDLFTWIHFFVGRENKQISRPDRYPDARDYAHESGGFLTWHRLYLLWFEREMQILTGNDTFTIPYWDWSEEDNREALFDDDWFGSIQAGGNIGGSVFGNWITVCWSGKTNKDLINTNSVDNVCNPTRHTGRLRRCPLNSLCNKNANTWPDKNEVDRAVNMKTYDNEPFSRESEAGFRNFVEGFEHLGNDCDGSLLCDDGIRRRLHNSIHLILGIGDFRTLENDETVNTGTMADVAGAANDPMFISHHAMIDNIFEKWLQKNKGSTYAPTGSEASNKPGHRANDVLVPFIPLYTNTDLFKEAKEFGYEYDGAKSGLSVGVSVVTMMVMMVVIALVV